MEREENLGNVGGWMRGDDVLEQRLEIFCEVRRLAQEIFQNCKKSWHYCTWQIRFLHSHKKKKLS
jgi:hypothetical protein